MTAGSRSGSDGRSVTGSHCEGNTKTEALNMLRFFACKTVPGQNGTLRRGAHRAPGTPVFRHAAYDRTALRRGAHRAPGTALRGLHFFSDARKEVERRKVRPRGICRPLGNPPGLCESCVGTLFRLRFKTSSPYVRADPLCSGAALGGCCRYWGVTKSRA